MRMKLSLVKQQQSLILAKCWWQGVFGTLWVAQGPDFCRLLRQKYEVALFHLG